MRLRTLAPAKRTLVSLTVAVVTAIGIPLVIASSAAAAPEPPTSETTTQTGTRAADQDAAFYLNIARGTVRAATGKVDTTTVETQIAALSDTPALPSLSVEALTAVLRTATGELARAVIDHDAQAAAAAAAAQALAQANTPDAARATARALAASRYGWGDGQFSCLSSLWQKESGWNYRAHNASGASGIPQALPGSKMASSGTDWAANAAVQISWGLDYIARAYGSPCAAWGHSQSFDWY